MRTTQSNNKNLTLKEDNVSMFYSFSLSEEGTVKLTDIQLYSDDGKVIGYIDESSVYWNSLEWSVINIEPLIDDWTNNPSEVTE